MDLNVCHNYIGNPYLHTIMYISIAATDGVDYDTSILPTLVTFNNQENQRTVQINIIDDNIPELAEYFTIHLANPQGGSALINPTQVSYHSYTNL